MPQKREIAVFISSPGDLKKEREIVENAVRQTERVLGDELKFTLRVKRWEDLPPAAGPAQDNINRTIGSYDIFVGVMGDRFGSRTQSAASGTEEEFNLAYDSWRRNGAPEIMFYFASTHSTPETADQAQQLHDVFAFRENISARVQWKEYSKPEELKDQLAIDLPATVRNIVQSPAPEDGLVQDHHEGLPRIPYFEPGSLASTSDTLSDKTSFLPSLRGENAAFIKMRTPTTRGWVRRATSSSSQYGVEQEQLAENFVYIVRDPIRPFTIQIGETRSRRKAGSPTAIPDLTNLDLGSIRHMYPFLQVTGFKWIRMVLAELSTDPKILDFVHDNDPDPHVKSIAARNPSASSSLQASECIFCKDEFLNHRLRPSGSARTRIMHNDFPYGPYFHYIAFPSRAIHSWEELTFADLFDLNKTMWGYLRSQREQGNWSPSPAGVHIGLNSTIKHLVIGSRTLTSAGASIPHVHKQVWGMAPGTNVLGDHLNELCQHFSRGAPVCDYLGTYLSFLRDHGMVLHEDENVVLYVPLGQISVHELQIMMARPGKTDFLSLTMEEVKSLSRAEAIAVECLKRLEIKSFNEVTVGLPFDSQSKWFRLVVSFVTREVDLAVSELNQLFVVDRHPEDTRDLLEPALGRILQLVETGGHSLPTPETDTQPEG